MKTTIYLETIIYAPVERCFDLARSIDFHQVSTDGSNERVVAGRMKGLISQGETVTWEATHFLVRQMLTTKIVSMQRPLRFYDVVQQGAFKSMEHVHTFQHSNGRTTMIDEFVYETPFGLFGRLFDKLVLKRYMTRLLTVRNHSIKHALESDVWKQFL
jgi:ligand-binding SRPBCC domain-containing protein